MTSVEFLVEEMSNKHSGARVYFNANKKIVEQAKEMEQAQRKKDFTSGNECACMCHENIDDYFNQYIKSEI